MRTQGKEARRDGKRAGGQRPDAGAIDTREDVEHAGKDEPFGGAVKVPEIESMSVVCLPSREEHRKTGNEGCEDAGSCWAESDGGSLAKGRECAVEGVDAVVEELAESGGGACATRLLSINVIHGGIQPEPDREGVIEPCRSGADEIGAVDRETENVGQDTEEAEERHHVRSEPEGKEIDCRIPLR